MLLRSVHYEELMPKLKKLYDIVKSRMILLKQSPETDVLPEISEYVIDKKDISLTVSKPPIIAKKSSDPSESYPSSLSYEDIDAFLRKQLDNHNVNTAYCEKLLETNRDKEYSKYLLDNAQQKGLPGVVDNIILYYSTLEKVADGKLYLHLLTFDDMLALQERCLKEFKIDLFSNSKFCDEYLNRFGSVTPKCIDDPAEVDRVIAVYNRRIDFVRARCPAMLVNAYESLLQFKTKVGVFDDDLLEYLKVKGKASKKKQTLNKKKVMSYNMGIPSWVETILYHLFPAQSVEVYFPYYEVDDLLRIYERAVLMSGKEMKPTVLSAPEVAALREETRLRILTTNKRTYSTGEEVKIQVELKSIESLEVRLYEVDTYAYYEKNDSDIAVTLDVDGLQPQFSHSYSYKLPSVVKHVETFSFPEINHRGVFIVDFISNGSNSRFLVRMGSLFVLSRKCLSGYALTVVDEAGSRVEQGLRAVVDAREYTLSDDKEIIVPYLPPSESAKSAKVLICQQVEAHWEFVTKYSLFMEPEEFSLNVAGNVDNEAIVPGNEECPLLLRTSVTLNGIAFPVSLLRNVSITLSIVSMQGVKSQTVVAPKTLDDAKDFVYTFRVAESTESVRADVSGDVALNNGTISSLSGSCTLFDNGAEKLEENTLVKSVPSTLHMFRRLDKSRAAEYVVEMNGPSGEVLPEVPVRVTVNHRFASKSYSTTLQTDAKGLIHLGSLANVASVRVEDTTFCPYTNHYDVRTLWRVAESEATQAMIPIMSKNPADYRLVCNETRDEYAPLANNITFDAGYCVVSGLKAGRYTLYVKDENGCSYAIDITVTATSGEAHVYESYAVWKNDARALQDLPLALECSLSANKLSVAVHGGDETRRVAVLCRTFLDGLEMGDALSKTNRGDDVEWYSNDLPQCEIANERKLWEEYTYIMERRKHPRTLPGNMLPAPGLLLNPVEFSSTTTKTKEAKPEEDFASVENARRRGRARRDYAGRLGAAANMSTVKSVDSIAVPSVLIANVELKEGVGEVTLPASAYGSEILVVAMDSSHSADSLLYMPEESEQKGEEKCATCLLKTQSLDAAFAPSTHYVEEKHISVVTKEKPLVLESKASMEILHCRKDVWQLLDMLSSIANLSKFSFLQDWESLSPEEKMNRYNRYNCSELNVFIYFRDRPFFDQCIKEYLESRIEKSFLDSYLTGGDVSAFLEPAQMARLNSFEKALLCSRLGEEGEALCKGMEHESQYAVMDSEDFSRVFNTALNLKSMKKEELPVEPEAEAEAEAEEAEAEDDGVQEEEVMMDDMERSCPPMMPMCCMAAAPTASPASYSRGASYAPTSPSFAADGVGFGARMSRPRMLCGGPLTRCKKMSADVKNYREKKAEKLYEKMEKTKEYREGYYYDVKKMYASPSLVPLSPFWSDFARYLRSGSQSPFMSKNFIYCTHSLSEVIFCLAVLDIAPSAPSFTIHHQGQEYRMATEAPLFVFHKLLKTTETEGANATIIVLQKYLDNKNSTETINGKTVDRYMTHNEFLPNEPYSCKIIMTNTSSREKAVTLFYQIPQGSFPLSDYQSMRTKTLLLKPYSTSLFSYSFYFPTVGEFTHYPAHLIDPDASSVIAYATLPFASLKVVSEIQTVDVTSWRDVAATASIDVVLQFLRTHNLNDIDWDCVTYRLKSKPFFKELVNALRSVGYYCDTVWKFGLEHRDFAAVRDYLQRHFVDEVGLTFKSPLLTVNPCVEELFQIREYKPYINNRCYRLGKSITINNDKLEAQYENLITLMTQKVPTTDDYALMVDYLILQDRIELAKQVFTTHVCDVVDGVLVKKADCTFAIQFDYMLAYFDCFTSELTQARAICKKYENYPVLYWKQLFANVASLVEEMDGAMQVEEEEEPVDRVNLPENTISKKRQLASRDSSLDIDTKDKKLEITYHQLERVEINYFELNVELMFSSNPFMKDSVSSSIFTRSNYAEIVALPSLEENVAFGTYEHPIPEAMKNKNLLIEVKSGALRETCYFFNSQLMVVLSSKTGQLRVYDKEKRLPLAACYVKVYAKTSDGKAFLKDGYTDIRGFFDYYSVSSDVCDRATRLAIFVEKEGFGSCIRDTCPPTSAVKTPVYSCVSYKQA